jgi:hypothetical protein
LTEITFESPATIHKIECHAFSYCS